MASLPDVNTMLALVFSEHEHSETAKKWLLRHSEPGAVGLCRVVHMGLLRLLTQTSVMRESRLTPVEAWSYWDALLTDDRFVYLEEPSGLEEVWSELSAGLSQRASVNTDTYLAAFAQAAGLTLVTFDGGFGRFPNLRVELLTP